MSQIKKLLSILGIFIICSCSQSGILSLKILKKNSIINIGFAGDTSFTHGIADDNPLKEISKITKKFDLMLLNLETVIARNDVGSTLEGKKYNFKSPIKSAKILKNAGIDGVALANNHSLDYGKEGSLDTMKFLENNNIKHSGIGKDIKSAYKPMLFNIKNNKIAIFSFSRVIYDISWYATKESHGIASAYDTSINNTISAIKDAKKDNNFVIVMVHWGSEKKTKILPYQLKLIKNWEKAGVDLIVGSHPHILGPIEKYDKLPVIFSTGNFAFPSSRGKARKSAIFSIIIDNQQIKQIKVIPIDGLWGVPVLSEKKQYKEIIRDLNKISKSYKINKTGILSSR
ncbi:MAG: poly-gamma-glutamate capsule biosynthesis protein CapA/YwtB (metallophosphatase superfamily) [Rickettsiales bacterium]